MAEKKSKVGFGRKEDIETALGQAKIDEYDLLCLDNGEFGWINAEKEAVINTPRTQSAIQVNGVTGLGIANGTTIEAGKSMDEIIKMLVQKSVPAAYSKPTVAIANNGGQASGAVESGTSITPKLRATFTKNDAGNLTKLEILKGGTSVGSETATPYDYTGEAIVIGDETITFTAKATYEEGAIKNDNLGQPSPNGHIEAGSITSSGYSIAGQRKAFWGSGTGTVDDATSDQIRKLTNARLNVTAGTNISLKVETGQQYIIFALPSPRTLKQVIYDDLGDKGMLSSFTKTTVQVADARGGSNGLMDYNCYVYNLSVPCSAPMNFTFVIA